MRHLARRLFTLCSAVSLLAGAGITALWARSCSAQDSFGYTAAGNPRVPRLQTWVVRSNRGSLSVERFITHLDKLPTGTSTERFEALHARWDKREPFHALHLRQPPGPSPLVLLAEPNMRGWYRLGFGRIVDRGLTYQSQDMVYIPHGAALAIAVSLPTCVMLRGARARRARRRGLCASCGYDLRATPGRCPECGVSSQPHVHRLSHKWSGKAPPALR